MESRNKLIMCRLCLDENGCFINVFELNDLHSYIAAEVITDLLQFQVSDSDGYPQVVCLTCLAKLTEFKLFKERCQQSLVTYDNMFVSSLRTEDRPPEMWESGTIKAEPTFHSDNEGDVSKEVGRGSEFCDQDPLEEESSQVTVKSEEVIIDSSSYEVSEVALKTNEVTVKSEEVIIDSSSYEVSEDPLKTNEVSCGPILLKYEVLPFSRDSHTQKEEGKETTPEKGIGGKHQRFECHCCTKVLLTKSGLKTHLASHGIGTYFKCDFCGQIFGCKANLVSHMPKHTREKPFKCTYCYKSYSRYNFLKVHMRIHTERNPFKCEKCKLSFNRSNDLETHISRCHSGSRPYSCEVCHANFRQMSNLTWHMRSHRKE